MEQSEKIELLATALVTFQAEVKNVTKEGENPFFHSKYATLKNILNTVRPTLTKNGLALSQFPTGEDGLTSLLMHESGQWLRSTVTMTPKDKTPQGQGSAITYMRRYAISSILGIATEDEDDGNQATKGKKEKVDLAKVEKIIKSTKNIDFLMETDEKIAASKLYTAEEKKKIKVLIKSQVDSLDGQQDK